MQTTIMMNILATVFAVLGLHAMASMAQPCVPGRPYLFHYFCFVYIQRMAANYFVQVPTSALAHMPPISWSAPLGTSGPSPHLVMKAAPVFRRVMSHTANAFIKGQASGGLKGG